MPLNFEKKKPLRCLKRFEYERCVTGLSKIKLKTIEPGCKTTGRKPVHIQNSPNLVVF